MTDGKSEVKETRYPDGKLESRKVFVDGKRHGLSEGWYENGQQHYKWNYMDDKRHGMCECWHENGQQEYKYNFVNGKPHGLTEEWYPKSRTRLRNENGQKMYKVNYVDGKRHGKQIYWTSDGVATIRYFVFDVEVPKPQFDARTTIIVAAIAEAIGSPEKALGALIDEYATI